MGVLLRRAMMEACICSVKNKIKSLVKVGMSNIMSGMFSKNNCVAFLVLINCAIDGSFTGLLERRKSCDEKLCAAQGREIPNYGVSWNTQQGKDFLKTIEDTCRFPAVIAQLVGAFMYANPHPFCYEKLLFTRKNDQADVLAFLNNGRYLAAGFKSGCIERWNLAEERLSSKRFSGRESDITALADLDNGYFAMACADNTIHILNIETHHRLYKLVGHTETVQAFEMVSSAMVSSKILVSLGTDAFRFWNLETGMCIKLNQVLPNLQNPIVNMGQGYIALLGDRGPFKVYQMPRARLVQTFQGAIDDILRVSKDLVVSGEFHGKVQWWDVQSGKEISCIKTSMIGRKKLALVEDRLLMGCDNGSISVIDIAKKKHLQTLFIPGYLPGLDSNPGVRALLVLPDGRFVAACSDGSVHMFTQKQDQTTVEGGEQSVENSNIFSKLQKLLPSREK
jgi:WD40 repeat protein